MRIPGRHWLIAGAVATALHVAVFLGWQDQFVGEAATPPAGPSIEIAETLAGIVGTPEVVTTEQPTEVTTEERPKELLKPEPPEPLKPDQPEPLNDVAMTAPVVTPSELPDKVQVPTVDKVEETKAEDLTPPKPKAEPVKKKPKKKKVERKKPEKKKAKKKTKRTKKTAKTKGNSKKGAGGRSKGGGGKSKSRASSGAVNAYGGRVRARILSRAPSGGGGKGRTVVSFGVSKSGGLRFVRVSRSSGNPGLDRKALSAVRRASPFPKPPSGASNRQLTFSISFRFR